MSYRIMMNDVQLFGNNEYPKPFLTFLKESSVKIDGSGYFDHTFPVGTFDVMKAVNAIEEYVENERRRYRKGHPDRYFYDYSEYEKTIDAFIESKDENLRPEPLLDWLTAYFHTGYMFIPLLFIETLLKQGCIKPCKCYSDGTHLYCYTQIKEIHVRGS